MHLLLMLLLLVGGVWLWTVWRRQASPVEPAFESYQPPADASRRALGLLSRGKLFCKLPGEALRAVHSPHIQSLIDRMERSRSLHGWKQGTSLGASFTRREVQSADAQLGIKASSAQFTGDGRVLYFLRDDSVGGLFEQQLSDGSERRLMHQQNLLLDDLRLDAEGRQLLCACHGKSGIANIALMNADGSGYRELTGGDTVDIAPAWIPGDRRAVVFQSAGLARNTQGFAIASGPASIQMVDLDKGELTPVMEDTRYDFLQPRVGPEGHLYFIRRPHEAPAYDTGNALMDALLFPFRLLRALFHYLNFFSLMYTRKPLTTATGPALDADLKEIVLKGKRLDAEAALRRGGLVDGVPSLVPASWQLVCRNQQGQERVLANHVACFDLTPEGQVLFSNGYGVFALGRGAATQLLLKDQLVTELIAG